MKQTLTLLMATILFTAGYSQLTTLKSNLTMQPLYRLDTSKGFLLSYRDTSLWISDGTRTGTVRLASGLRSWGLTGAVNGKYLFTAFNATRGIELYATDGTVAGTNLVKDLNPGPTSSFPSDFVIHQGKLYFTCETPAYGRELWATDGTDAGTALVKDIIPGAYGSNNGGQYALYSDGTMLFFAAYDFTAGLELWKSDGTDAGTVLIKDLNPGFNESTPRSFTKCGNVTIFSAWDNTNGRELWRTNGTAAGTYLLKDITPGFNGYIDYLQGYSFSGKVYFTAMNPTSGSELWVTDGTTAGTIMMKDINPGGSGSFPQLFRAYTIGNKFMFPANDGVHGTELWQCNGTLSGTKMVKDLAPGIESSSPNILPTVNYNLDSGPKQPLFNNKFFFTAYSAATGSELWVTDGTSTGTKMVRDINPGAGDGASFSNVVYTTNAVYFIGNDGINGNELWKTTGSLASTKMVANINPGAASSYPTLGLVINNRLLFSAENGIAPGAELYSLGSNVVSLKSPFIEDMYSIAGETRSFSLLQNPVLSQLRYTFKGSISNPSIIITDLMGRVQMRGSLSAGTGSIAVGELAQGVYNITVFDGDIKKTYRFVKR